MEVKTINKNGILETEYKIIENRYKKDGHFIYSAADKFIYSHGKTLRLYKDKELVEEMWEIKKRHFTLDGIVQDRTVKDPQDRVIEYPVVEKCKICGEAATHVDNYTKNIVMESVYDNENSFSVSSLVEEYGVARGEIKRVVSNHRITFNKTTLGLYKTVHYRHGSRAVYKMRRKGLQPIINLNGLGNVDLYLSCFSPSASYMFVQLIDSFFNDKYKKEYTYYKSDYYSVSCNNNDVSYFDINKLSMIAPFIIKKKYDIEDNFLAIYLLKLYQNNVIKSYLEFNGMKLKDFSSLYNISVKDLNVIFRPGYSYYKSLDMMAILSISKSLNTNLVKKLVSTNKPYAYLNISNINSFTKMYIKKNSFKKIENILADDIKIRDYADCCRMYYIIKKTKNYKKFLNSIDFKASFSDFHDSLTELANKIKDENAEIKYTDKFKKKFDGMEFQNIKYKLAACTDDLLMAGQIMCICVSSYRELAVNKNTNILIGYEGNEPVTCIQINENGNSLSVLQVKGKYNYKKSNDEIDYLMDTFAKLKIKISTLDLSKDKENCESIAM